MGALSSEILHFLNVKLPLQNDQRWLLLLSWFSNFFGGGPPTPLLGVCPTLLNTKGKVRYTAQGVNHTRKWGLLP